MQACYGDFFSLVFLNEPPKSYVVLSSRIRIRVYFKRFSLRYVLGSFMCAVLPVLHEIMYVTVPYVVSRTTPLYK